MIDSSSFWKQTKKEGNCLIWTGQIHQEPVYGIFFAFGGRLIAHRVAYQLTCGPLPAHAHLGRTCDNPLCVEPKHLFLQNSNNLEEIKLKIESNIEKDDCWHWKGKAPKCLSVNKKLKILPRAIYEIYNDVEIARDKEVIRTCETSDCLNPDHLSLIDKASLGKSNSKLTSEQIKQIRELAKSGKFGITELSEKFLTSRQTIYTIVYNLGWIDHNYIPPEKMPRKVSLCRKGHSMSGDNLIVLESGVRKCRICTQEKLGKVVPRKTLEERFWAKIYKSKDGCWDWTAYSKNGWGYFNIDRVPQLAHRVAYELTNGKIPEGAKVKHSCTNNLCCNPEHLYLD